MRSGARTAPDMGRLARAVSRPGIDPRLWASLAVVDAVQMDAAEGYFADVTLLPSEDQETARVGTEYAGAQWGSHRPVDVGDEVLVIAPSGDADEGLVIAGRLHSPADKPPAGAVSYPTDCVDELRPGKNYRLAVSSNGRVHLGTLATQHPCFQADDWNAAWATFDTAWTAMNAAWLSLVSAWVAHNTKLLVLVADWEGAGGPWTPIVSHVTEYKTTLNSLAAAITAYTAARAAYATARATFKSAAVNAQTVEVRVD